MLCLVQHILDWNKLSVLSVIVILRRKINLTYKEEDIVQLAKEKMEFILAKEESSSWTLVS